MENLKQKGEMFLKEIQNSEKPIENVIFSPLGTVFVTPQNDKRVVVYDSTDFSVLHDFPVNNAVKDARFLKEDQLLVVDQLGMIFNFQLFRPTKDQEPVDLELLTIIGFDVSSDRTMIGFLAKTFKSRGQNILCVDTIQSIMSNRSKIEQLKYQLIPDQGSSFERLQFGSK